MQVGSSLDREMRQLRERQLAGAVAPSVYIQASPSVPDADISPQWCAFKGDAAFVKGLTDLQKLVCNEQLKSLSVAVDVVWGPANTVRAMGLAQDCSMVVTPSAFYFADGFKGRPYDVVTQAQDIDAFVQKVLDASRQSSASAEGLYLGDKPQELGRAVLQDAQFEGAVASIMKQMSSIGSVHEWFGTPAYLQAVEQEAAKLGWPKEVFVDVEAALRERVNSEVMEALRSGYLDQAGDEDEPSDGAFAHLRERDIGRPDVL